jgi:hypothetical protein
LANPASNGSTLFGSADSIRKINAKGVGIAAKDNDEKTMTDVEAGNQLLHKAVGFLGTMVNKTPPAIELRWFSVPHYLVDGFAHRVHVSFYCNMIATGQMNQRLCCMVRVRSQISYCHWVKPDFRLLKIV